MDRCFLATHTYLSYKFTLKKKGLSVWWVSTKNTDSKRQEFITHEVIIAEAMRYS